jgi:aspartyl/asparaginyl beta-hydroxylase (cupin superfamily)
VAQQFHDSAHFAFTGILQENLKVVQNEFKNLREVYKANDYIPEENNFTLAQGNMQWMTFWDCGNPKDAVRKLCPRTTKLLETIHDLVSNTPFGSSYFLHLGQNTSIKPYTGFANITLKCHLPLFVPGEGFLRVGGKFAQWEEGQLLVFDESFSHEMVNLDKEKSILAFDIWHPDLTKEERGLLIQEYKTALKKHKK